jgi:hypothetical protein
MSFFLNGANFSLEVMQSRKGELVDFNTVDVRSGRKMFSSH